MFNLIKEIVPRNGSMVSEKRQYWFWVGSRIGLPSSTIRASYFHMKQCIWSRVQNLGLTEQYRTDEEFKLHVSMCPALAFLKPEDVYDGWLEIWAGAPDSINYQKLHEFFVYFVANWLENENVLISMRICYGKWHRTTNALEGWHNKLNSIIRNPNPWVCNLMICLKKEAEHTDHIVKTPEMNLPGNKRKKPTWNLTTDWRERPLTNNISSCLKTISYVQKLD